MSRYKSYLAQVDVTRGRRVPLPPDQIKLHQLLPPKNPYTASRDTRLLPDLLATLQGAGAALRVLAVLEAEVASSWQAEGLTLELKETEVSVYWKDPVVLGIAICSKWLIAIE